MYIAKTIVLQCLINFNIEAEQQIWNKYEDEDLQKKIAITITYR